MKSGYFSGLTSYILQYGKPVCFLFIECSLNLLW